MLRKPTLTAVALTTLFTTALNAAELPSGSVELKGKRFSIEIAADRDSQEYGLMNRVVMPADHGMLFVFPTSERQTFWMKDTKISLDIFYFDENRKLVNVQQRVPPCLAAQSMNCPVYPSSGPAKYVLELNGGAAEKLGVVAGDVLTIEETKPSKSK